MLYNFVYVMSMLSVIVHHLCALPIKTEPQCE